MLHLDSQHVSGKIIEPPWDTTIPAAPAELDGADAEMWPLTPNVTYDAQSGSGEKGSGNNSLPAIATPTEP